MTRNETVYADELSYWKTSTTSPDNWISKTKRIIEDNGGSVVSDLQGTINGRTAFMINFVFNGESYRITFPTMPTRKPADQPAAKIQAATLIYHEVKSRIMASLVLGKRVAFFQYYVLPSGKTPAEGMDINETMQVISGLQLASGNEDDVIIGVGEESQIIDLDHLSLK